MIRPLQVDFSSPARQKGRKQMTLGIKAGEGDLILVDGLASTISQDGGYFFDAVLSSMR
jgi:hypothetical protein